MTSPSSAPVVLALVLALVVSTAWAKPKKPRKPVRPRVPVTAPAAATAPEITGKEADLRELRGRIDSLRKDLANSEEDRASAAGRLRAAEREISKLQLDLRRLAGQRDQLQGRLQALGQQSESLEKTLAEQQRGLEKLLYAQYRKGRPDALYLLLNGDDPSQAARDLHYLSAIAHAQAELLGEIRASLERQKTLAAQTREKAEELAAVEAEQKTRQTALEQQREERKALLAEASSRVQSQRREISTLQEDEKRMSRLIERLSKALAAQAAARSEKEAKETKAPPGKEASAPPAEGPPPRKAVAENRYEPVATRGAFAHLKGQLRLPVRGMIAGRFGGAREGGGTWKGLFIRADSGEVKSVAGGRVVFAEWMRGFGNLIIVDHGEAYLSIYGNNEALLKQVGETVQGGEALATVGNSGGNPESGLYFELRHQGQPIDPMKWARLK